MSTLMRQELELAKAGGQGPGDQGRQGRGHARRGRLCRPHRLLFLSIALWWALSHLVGHSWSALIVAVIWRIVAAVLYSMGRKQIEKVNPKPERTVDTLQQVPGALKPN